MVQTVHSISKPTKKTWNNTDSTKIRDNTITAAFPLVIKNKLMIMDDGIKTRNPQAQLNLCNTMKLTVTKKHFDAFVITRF